MSSAEATRCCCVARAVRAPARCRSPTHRCRQPVGLKPVRATCVYEVGLQPDIRRLRRRQLDAARRCRSGRIPSRSSGPPGDASLPACAASPASLRGSAGSSASPCRAPPSTFTSCRSGAHLVQRRQRVLLRLAGARGQERGADDERCAVGAHHRAASAARCSHFWRRVIALRLGRAVVAVGDRVARLRLVASSRARRVLSSSIATVSIR